MIDKTADSHTGPRDFVGIECSGKDTVIAFPIGFHGYDRPVRLSDYMNCSDDKYERFRKDARLLVDVLLKYASEADSNKPGIDIMFGKFDRSDDTEAVAPAQAWYYLINDFLSNGYWTEPKTVFSERRTGKIDWKRTISSQLPYIKDENAVYLDFIVRNTFRNEDELISSIHKWCVYESFSRLGWLFSACMPEIPNIQFQKNLFLSAINDKLSSVYSDAGRLRLLCMRAVIQHAYENNVSRDYRIGTDRFENVWEYMVDRAFGTEFGRAKEQYYPKVMWHTDDANEDMRADDSRNDESSLRPDTILKLDDKVIVLDAKYRDYCCGKNAGRDTDSLPWAAEINKQITYGEYAQKVSANKPVYNAFVLPFDGQEEDLQYKIFGCAYGNWESPDIRYALVQGLFADTKYLMTQYRKADSALKENAADLIAKATDIYISTNT